MLIWNEYIILATPRLRSAEKAAERADARRQIRHSVIDIREYESHTIRTAKILIWGEVSRQWVLFRIRRILYPNTSCLLRVWKWSYGESDHMRCAEGRKKSGHLHRSPVPPGAGHLRCNSPDSPVIGASNSTSWQMRPRVAGTKPHLQAFRHDDPRDPLFAFPHAIVCSILLNISFHCSVIPCENLVAIKVITNACVVVFQSKERKERSGLRKQGWRATTVCLVGFESLFLYCNQAFSYASLAI
jgi:hypothetical protein